VTVSLQNIEEFLVTKKIQWFSVKSE